MVLRDRLRPNEREALAETFEDPDLWGVLRPVGEPAGRSYRALNHETALLLLTLASDPGPVPEYVREEPGGLRQLAELVLDGVVEIEAADGYVAGPDALPLLQTQNPASDGMLDAPTTSLGRKSLDALRWAARLREERPSRLALKLYNFGRLPLTPAWQRRLSGPGDVLEFLGLNGSGSDAPAASGWRRRTDDGWISWYRNGISPRAADDGVSRSATYKLYVSPDMEDLPRVAGALPALLSCGTAKAFKVGADAAGLLRSDKMVIYFRDLESLVECGHRLADELSGTAPHGVPFTAEIAGDGLLSWGVDPPVDALPAGLSRGESWRQWVIERLAAALIRARKSGQAAPWRFALERLRLDGVDVDRWVPEASRWNLDIELPATRR